MGAEQETLQIGLEDVGGTSWWAGILTTVASQSGVAQLRFVGVVDGVRRYKGATFPSPRTFGSVPPDEQWAPGMTASLQQLKADLEADGWVQVGRGPDPWAFRYCRARASGRAPG